MKVSETILPGVSLIEPRVFADGRGFFMESWHAERYGDANIPGPFVQANFSHSNKGVLRGLHYQLKHPQGKLVWVISGEVFDVAVDIRVGSPTFGRWAGEILSGDNRRQLFIPPGFAHGYCVLSDTADFFYLCTEVYVPQDEYGVRWDDGFLKIDWPISLPVVSEKDRQYPTLDSIPKEHLPVWEACP